ncbi:MAG: 4Fe-4S ferredoxin, partial [Desulfobacterales bacterium]
EGCDKPGEVCFLFGEVANFYIESKLGRKIDHPEVLEILKKADEAGLVLQSTSFQKIINIT